MYPNFLQDIQRMNERYQLAPIPANIEAIRQRLVQFQDILEKECAEIVDIQGTADTPAVNFARTPGDALIGTCEGYQLLEVVTQLADLLGDIIVYCASEAMRWGIPLPMVMQLIMASNTSKLGADGKPIINPTNGKFEKGPNYWAPEEWIQQVLLGNHELINMRMDEHGVFARPTLVEPPPQEAANDKENQA